MRALTHTLSSRLLPRPTLVTPLSPHCLTNFLSFSSLLDPSFCRSASSFADLSHISGNFSFLHGFYTAYCRSWQLSVNIMSTSCRSHYPLGRFDRLFPIHGVAFHVTRGLVSCWFAQLRQWVTGFSLGVLGFETRSPRSLFSIHYWWAVLRHGGGGALSFLPIVVHSSACVCAVTALVTAPCWFSVEWYFAARC
ncbi:hypothetical protein Nepgr_024377 [Nepenthes gracilis]|uniref:Uncharacterized protein n=1 Tax=Nepenthes gracilis TaxID=150966 RepID=A0AAD3T531_NEPGR|nr:hypothetical protein Nepgr_024377 [Nepenthes gracilis]